MGSLRNPVVFEVVGLLVTHLLFMAQVTNQLSNEPPNKKRSYQTTEYSKEPFYVNIISKYALPYEFFNDRNKYHSLQR